MTNDKYLPAKAVEIHKHRVRMKYGLAIEAMQTILNLANDTITDPAYAIAASMALDALKREAADNDPLTIEELRGMDGEPVWTVGVSCTPDGSWAMWDIIERVDDDGIDFGYSTESKEWWDYNLRNKDGTLCGCAWLAYRRKPEGSGRNDL